ncbi:MAG TPA: CPBP family glutamic-type intramembrane protease [Polyangiaceae bacterium]
MSLVVVAWVGTTAAIGFAFRSELAGTTAFWSVLSVAYALLGSLVAWRLWRSDRLLALLRLRAGDLTWGVLVAGVLLVSSFAARAVVAPPGTPEHAWLLGLYLQIGDPDVLQRSVSYTLVLLALPLLEELVWRGGVLDELNRSLGERRGWLFAALLYATAHLPSAYTMRAADAGLNPLLVLAALGCGLCWSFMARMFDRLPPVMVSHAVFTYFSATQFRVPGA